MAEEQQEQQLRDLLERAVPRLPAPEGRMDGVRRRVARRRQRRTAGAAVVAVAGIALAGTLLPDALRGPSEALPVPPATRPAAPPATPAPALKYPGLGGLVVRLPAGWEGLTGTGGTPTGFAANVPMAAYKEPCTLPLEQFCAPLTEKLGAGDGLIAFSLRPDTLSEVGKDSLFDVVTRQSGTGMVKSCVTAGGTQELHVWRKPGPAAPGRAVYAVACLAKPTPATVERIGDALRTATFDTSPGSDATKSPGTR